MSYTQDQLKELLQTLNEANGITDHSDKYVQGALRITKNINGLQLVRIHSTGGTQSRVNPVGSLTKKEMYLYLSGMVEMLKF